MQESERKTGLPQNARKIEKCKAVRRKTETAKSLRDNGLAVSIGLA